MNSEKIKKRVEGLNILSHLIGALTGIGLLIYTLINRNSMSTSFFIGFLIYTATFTFLFSASSIYHYAHFCHSRFTKLLRVFDHSAIYLFIAGSYTPFLLKIFTGIPRIATLITIWSIAFIGIIFKIITYGNFDRFKNLSVGLYILMGWLSVFMIYRIYKVLGVLPIIFLAFGGLLYSLGTIFYKNNKLTYHHVIWHFFVLAGAFTQLASVLLILQY